jgi:decaprenyl-phosphate phosphoribosyltransferase
MVSDFIKLARPHHYTKNLFVFAPLFFSGMLFNAAVLLNTLLAFLFFSLAASAIYVLNDLKDIAEDQTHPKKKFRPIASGRISKHEAIFFALILAPISIIGSYYLSTDLMAVIVIYILLNFFYSLGLKLVSIIDISIIALGFVLRVFAGSEAIDVQPSMWIILMTFLLALFLALAKRRDDVILSSQGLTTRKNIDGYNLEFVNAAMVIISSVILVAYIFYTISTEVQERLQTEHLYLTVIFVLVGIMRYMQITFVENDSGSPTKIVLKDRFLQITILMWAVAFGSIIYSNGI